LGEIRNVLVTGATGFLGRRITARLLSAGYELTALVLPSERLDDRGRMRVVHGDIVRPETLNGHFHGHHAVVHLAGAVGYGQNFERCYALNRDGTANVAAAAAAAGARRFLHMSSVSVYGRVTGVALDEDAPLRKIGDPYGDTKIDAESVVTGFAGRGLLDTTILRPTVIYGPGDDKFLPRLVENLRSGKARVVGEGDNRIDLVHVDDVADLVVAALRAPRSIGRVYNVAHPGNPTWGEFLPQVAALLGVAPPTTRLPYPVAYAAAWALEVAARVRGDTPRLTRYAVRVVGKAYDYPVARAQSELGFDPKVELMRGIAECLGHDSCK
jgi:nucleoside-diphosphate-sugar epimerase